MTGIGTST